MKYSIQEVEEKISQAIEKAQAQGWVLTRHVTVDTDRHRCCPLGAMTLANEIRFQDYGQELDLSLPQCYSIADGFDTLEYNSHLFPYTQKEYYDLGMRLAKKYLPIANQNKENEI